jgi:pimeloyl-ACP methyl ester carboxylesterase
MEKNSIVLPNYETYHYLDEGNKSKPVLVLLHGNQSSSIHHKPLIERLQEDFRIIAPDLRGFGDSTYRQPIDSLEDFSDDVIALLGLLKIEKYALLGWSTGGGIALKMAAKEQGKVSKVILVESCSYRGYPIFKKDASGMPNVGEFYSSKDELSKDPIQVAPLITLFEEQNKSMLHAIWDAAIYTVKKPSEEDNELYLKETLKQRNILDVLWALTTFNMSTMSNGVTLGDGSINDVKAPVLTIWGDKDAVVFEYMVDETKEALKDCTKVIFEQSGHSPYMDRPDELAFEVKAFLQEQE